MYIPANKNPILKLDGNLNFLKTYPNTGDLIPGSAGHTLLSSLSNNFFDV